jgi:uncharacterized protein (TIGR03437 family)
LNRIRSMMMVLAAGWLCVGVAAAQTAANLTIISGNGQVVCQLCTNGVPVFYQPMVAQATDVNGNPVPGATVNWTIASGGGVFQQSNSNSYSEQADSNGMATATLAVYNPQSGSPLFSDSQTSITASTSTASSTATVTFYATQALLDLTATAGVSELPVTATALNNSLLPGVSYSGQLGTTAQTPIKIAVLNQAQGPIANVAVFLVDALTNTGAPTISCQGSPGAGPNVVLTDSTGTATCYPVYGGTPGTGVFWVDVGGTESTTTANFPSSEYYTFPLTPYNPSTGTGSGYSYTVTPGTPGSISVVSGSTQSASPGQSLAQPLVAQVVNASGQPLAGVPVTWTVSPANAATLSASTTTGTNGQTTNTVTLTSAATGTVTITATASGTNNTATFTITVIPPVTITGFQIVSGNNQSAVIGTAFGQPLVVQVSTSTGSASGITVQFQVESGSVTLSAPSAVTNSSGQAQVTAQAGSAPGAATVLASVSSTGGGSSQTFNLTVVPQGPAITASNFYNGADQQPNSLSPCGLGQLIAGSLGVANLSQNYLGLPLPQSALVISFNSTPAPILNIGTNAQGQQFALFQVPCSVSPANGVPVTVAINGSSTNVSLNVTAASPGVFRTVASGNVAIAVMVRPDGSYVSLTNPARRGETEVVYVTGLGATTPTVNTTELPVPGGAPSIVTGTVIPGMSGGGLPLVSAQLSDDLPGVYLVSFQIPSNEAQGNNTFSIGIIPAGGSTPYYSAPVTVPVQ